jgi:thiol:disulfide interchange protein
MLAGEPPGGLVGRIIAFVVGLVMLAVAVFVGAIFIAALAGLLLIGGLLFAVRVWWLKRKMQRYAKEHGDLRAEYTVVQEERREIGHGDRQ